jgi:hypothetical protein
MKKFVLLVALVVIVVLVVGALLSLFFAGIGLMLFALKYLMLPAILIAAGIYCWRRLTAKM